MAENVGDGSTGENPEVAQPTHFAFDEQSRPRSTRIARNTRRAARPAR